MTREDIIKMKRRKAEVAYQSSLQAIDAEVDQAFKAYEAELDVIRAFEVRMSAVADQMRMDAARRFGFNEQDSAEEAGAGAVTADSLLWSDVE